MSNAFTLLCPLLVCSTCIVRSSPNEHSLFQVSVTITSEKSVRNVLSSIARELFKADISWCKIVSLYCTAGGLAVDCVRQGHPEYLFGIVDTMGLVVERDISTWMAQQGGWVSE